MPALSEAEGKYEAWFFSLDSCFLLLASCWKSSVPQVDWKYFRNWVMVSGYGIKSASKTMINSAFGSVILSASRRAPPLNPSRESLWDILTLGCLLHVAS